METNDKNLQLIQEPGYTLWAGLFPFVLLGAMALLFEVPHEWGSANLFMILGGLLMFGGYLVILAGLYVGAVTGFPRWAFPYLFYAFVFAFYISNDSTPGLVVFNIEMWGRDLWGWRAWVPLGIVMLLVPILNRHPWKLLKSLWDGVVNDWSRLAFGLYAFFPFLVLLIFDEMEHTYSFPGAVVGEVLIVFGAFLYLRLSSPFWRTFGMVASAFLGILVVNVTTHFYWDTHSVNFVTGERHLLEGPIPYTDILAKAVTGAAVATLFLLLPVVVKILGLVVHFVQGLRKGLQSSG